jgi:uncharacterized membrane protein (DUF485 family)
MMHNKADPLGESGNSPRIDRPDKAPLQRPKTRRRQIVPGESRSQALRVSAVTELPVSNDMIAAATRQRRRVSFGLSFLLFIPAFGMAVADGFMPKQMGLQIAPGLSLMLVFYFLVIASCIALACVYIFLAQKLFDRPWTVAGHGKARE